MNSYLFIIDCRLIVIPEYWLLRYSEFINNQSC